MSHKTLDKHRSIGMAHALIVVETMHQLRIVS